MLLVLCPVSEAFEKGMSPVVIDNTSTWACSAAEIRPCCHGELLKFNNFPEMYSPDEHQAKVLERKGPLPLVE